MTRLSCHRAQAPAQTRDSVVLRSKRPESGEKPYSTEQVFRLKTTAEVLVELGGGPPASRGHRSPTTSRSRRQSSRRSSTPEFLERFDGIEHARADLRRFLAWYNNQHRHSRIGFMTPAAVHFGRASEIHGQRAEVLQAAYRAHYFFNRGDSKSLTHSEQIQRTRYCPRCNGACGSCDPPLTYCRSLPLGRPVTRRSCDRAQAPGTRQDFRSAHKQKTGVGGVFLQYAGVAPAGKPSL